MEKNNRQYKFIIYFIIVILNNNVTLLFIYTKIWAIYKIKFYNEKNHDNHYRFNIIDLFHN